MKRDFDHLIDLAFEEDFGNEGDVTAESIFTNEEAKAVLLAKQDGILAGSFIFERVFEKIDPGISIKFLMADGDALKSGDKVAKLTGKAVSLLKGERTALNFICFLSGIASIASRYVTEAKKYGKTVILDTRKTLPGYRRLSKYAVTMGGGTNHRQGLYDMVLIKDNHIDASGSITNAVSCVRKKWMNKFKIEVECRTLDDVKEALGLKVDVIMLDNMDVAATREAVKITGGLIPLEISGGVNLETLPVMANTGVSFISVGRLTHSAPAFDFSLDITVG
ncbi:MAG: carboxylating nicotinate-nucleotide diphosphorylase [Spirochaetaceae bacterium]|nr:MAG: carboxylating nicotinate-nucleotide diphosphorylase [Spirochaetaceae bacterium]